MDDVPVRFRDVHGYRRAYRILGRGTPLLLVHGIGDNSATWLQVMRQLARHHTVIAPDLLGHGQSDKPRANYSIAAYANGMRDRAASPTSHVSSRSSARGGAVVPARG